MVLPCRDDSADRQIRFEARPAEDVTHRRLAQVRNKRRFPSGFTCNIRRIGGHPCPPHRKRRPATACPGVPRQRWPALNTSGTEMAASERNRAAEAGALGGPVFHVQHPRDANPATAMRRASPQEAKPSFLLARPIVCSEASTLGGASARGASRHRVRLRQPDPQGSESGSTTGGRLCSSVLRARHPRPPGRSIGPLGAPLGSGPRCPKLALGPILRQSMPQVGRTPHPGVPSQPRY
jgi:hypothetical protein